MSTSPFLEASLSEKDSAVHREGYLVIGVAASRYRHPLLYLCDHHTQYANVLVAPSSHAYRRHSRYIVRRLALHFSLLAQYWLIILYVAHLVVVQWSKPRNDWQQAMPQHLAVSNFLDKY